MSGKLRRFTVLLSENDIEDCKLMAKIRRQDGYKWTMYDAIQSCFDTGIAELRERLNEWEREALPEVE